MFKTFSVSSACTGEYCLLLLLKKAKKSRQNLKKRLEIQKNEKNFFRRKFDRWKPKFGHFKQKETNLSQFYKKICLHFLNKKCEDTLIYKNFGKLQSLPWPFQTFLICALMRLWNLSALSQTLVSAGFVEGKLLRGRAWRWLYEPLQRYTLVAQYHPKLNTFYLHLRPDESFRRQTMRKSLWKKDANTSFCHKYRNELLYGLSLWAYRLATKAITMFIRKTQYI